MPTYWGIDYEDILVNEPGTLRDDIPTGSISTDQNINDILITKGTYRLTIRNPQSNVFIDSPIATQATFTDQDGILRSKAISVDNIFVNLQENKAIIIVTVHENPIPLIAIYGAVFIVVSVIGALSVESVFESIETVLDKPISWGIVAIILLAFIAPFIPLKHK